MRTTRRYLAKEIYRSSSVVLVALLGLFTFFALIEELDKVGTGFTLLNLFYMQALALPTYLYDLLPIGVLIGAVLALAGLAQRNELVILRVSGVSGFKLLGMLWLVTIPWVVGAFILSEVITPAAELKASDVSLRLLGRAEGGRMSSGYWFKEADAQGGTRIINIAQLSADGMVTDITLYEFREGQELASMSHAASGRFGDGALRLTDVTRTVIDDASVASLADGQRPSEPATRVEHLPERVLDTTLTPERLIARVLTPERMSILDLSDYIRYLAENNLQTERQVVALWRKIAYPFTLFVMMTIAAPIAFMQTRRGGVGSKVFVGILLGVGFFMVNQLALNVGMLSKWAPWVTALVPNLGALALAFGALLLMENRHGVRRFVQTRLPWSKTLA
jgi:lipopolysaccharide export system permease protein